MIQSRSATAIAAVAAIVTLGACGDGGSTTASTTSTGSSSSSSASSSAAAAGTISITDSQNRTVNLATNPETVIALDWSAVRTLNDLGIEVDGVAQSPGGLPDDLSATSKAKVVGTVFEPDYEAIEAMDPDLVIVGSRSGTPEVVAELEKVAPVVLDMSVRAEDPAQTFELTSQRVAQFGEIFGKSTEAKALMDGIGTQIEQVRTKAAASGTTAMVVQVSDGTVGAYGPGSRFGAVWADFGFHPTSAPLKDEGGHGDEVTQEFFLQYDPGAIFVLDRAKAIGEKQTPALQVLDNGLVNATTAAKDKKIVEIDGFSWYLASSAPSSWQQMVDDVSKAL